VKMGDEGYLLDRLLCKWASHTPPGACMRFLLERSRWHCVFLPSTCLRRLALTYSIGRKALGCMPKFGRRAVGPLAVAPGYVVMYAGQALWKATFPPPPVFTV
jgi:hypothetical protein